MRAAKPHRRAETLRRAERDIRAHGAGRFEQHQRHEVGSDRSDAALRLDGGDRAGKVDDFASFVGILEQRAEHFLLRGLLGRAQHQFETEEAGARPQHIDGLRQAAGIDEETPALRPGDAPRHRHRLGCGGGLVEQRGIG